MNVKPPIRILFICVDNSCRTIIAEAFMNHAGQGRYQGWSAGSIPKGTIHAHALQVLERQGINAGSPRSKSWNEFSDKFFDMIITICNEVAEEATPIFPGRPKRIHWHIPDPSKVTGSEDEICAAFDAAFQQLKEKIEELIC